MTRIRVQYETAYAYEAPVRAAIQLLRVTPRDHAGQRVARWRVDVDAEGRMRRGEDAFGNVLHTFTLGAPASALTVRVSGEVDTHDVAGVLGTGAERFPPAVHLRPTPLTTADAALADFTDAAVARTGPEPLPRLHALMAAVGDRIAFQTGTTDARTTAAQAFALGRGVCQDLAHVFIAGARRLGQPARYVSGHLLRDDPGQEAAHAWAEAWVDGLGWVGFDPVNGACPTERYVRVAAGPDYLAAAPVRGARSGGGAETLTVRLTVADASRAAV